MAGIKKRYGSLLGPTGLAPQIQAGTTIQVESGVPAAVDLVKVGTARYRADFTIPRGPESDGTGSDDGAIASHINTTGTATRSALTERFADRSAALAPRSPAPKPPRGHIISRFQPSDVWSDALGGWAARTDIVAHGTQSWGFDSGEGSNERYVTRLELPAPLDVRNKSLVLRAYISDTSKIRTFLPSFDSTQNAPPGLSDNSMQWPTPSTRQVNQGKWVDFVYSYAHAWDQAGTPDRQRMLRLAITVTTSGPIQFRLNSAMLVDRNTLTPDHPNGVIIIESDDGAGSNQLMHDVLSGYGVPGTINMIAENTDRPDRLSMDQLKKWQELDGWDIQGHSYALTTQNFLDLTPEELDEDLAKLKTWLRANGFDGEFVAYPQGGFNDEVKEITSRYFRGGRTVYNTPFTGPGIRPYEMAAWSVDNVTTPDQLKSYMDNCALSGTPCHILFHHWEEGAGPASQLKAWGTDQLREIVEHGLAQGYEFSTYSEVYT